MGAGRRSKGTALATPEQVVGIDVAKAFLLSDGADMEGPPALSAASLQAMHLDLGPGGTDGCEIDGVGVNWSQRRTAEGIPVYFSPGS
jgi:hypothetical protein